MKTIKALANLSLILGIVLAFTSCKDDDGNGGAVETGKTKTYALMEQNSTGVTGTVTFKELSDQSTKVMIELNGTPAGGEHPAHIHINSYAVGGGVYVALHTVNGDNGMSETTVSKNGEGTMMTYDDLIAFDGHINVHLSATEIATIVASGDIGGNVLTGEKTEYVLEERNNTTVSGMAMFENRMNGKTLVTLKLENTPANGIHPAHIHTGTAAIGGGVAISLTAVDGNSGMSYTDIAEDNDINYEKLIDFDGYINVHLSSTDLGTIVAQGDIGSNVFTGKMKEYTLATANNTGVLGKAHFHERMNGNVLVTLQMENTPEDGVHPAHIHMNSASMGGGVSMPLTSVDGNTGMSYTEIMKDDMVDFNYLINYDGHINVHLSGDNLLVVAQGNIGSNTP